MRTQKIAQLKRQRRKYIAISILTLLFCFLFCFVVAPLATYWYFRIETEAYIFESPESIPKTKTALVLGTSKYRKDGKVNQFFKNRIIAADILYGYNKVDKILLSGDHKNKSYDEPLAMKVSLREKGIPEDIMVMDPAGLRTFDSVINACKIYNEQNIVIVSQRFHLERALFIAQSQGLNAYGFVADDSDDEFANLRLNIREGYARMLTLMDIYVLNG